MKCYFHFDEKTGKKILIPYCWSVLWSDDIRDCRCESETFSKFENRKYNEVPSIADGGTIYNKTSKYKQNDNKQRNPKE